MFHSKWLTGLSFYKAPVSIGHLPEAGSFDSRVARWGGTDVMC